jgi:hypothetical protein
MIEKYSIPKISMTALMLARANFDRTAAEIANQTCEALGLDSNLNYNINFDTGFVTREVPDPEKEPAAP